MIWTSEQEAAALAFCREFEGTPHMQRRLKSGKGADCVRFTVGAIQAAGILPPFEWPTYAQDVGLNRPTNWLAGAFMDHFHASSVAVEGWQPRTGDVGIFKVGRTTNHVGLVVGTRFWHVTVTRAVHHCAIVTVVKALQEVIRFDAPGLKLNPVHMKTT